MADVCIIPALHARIVRYEPIEGPRGTTWEGAPEIVQRDLDGDGLLDVQLEDGSWVGYSSAAQALVVKPGPP